jgi:hypothetical protein
LVKCREEAGTTADGIAKFRAANWRHFNWLIKYYSFFLISKIWL